LKPDLIETIAFFRIFIVNMVEVEDPLEVEEMAEDMAGDMAEALANSGQGQVPTIANGEIR
jgi:hypothetical protein